MTLLAGMEHVLVAIMVMVLFFVPDVPYSVQLQIARKRYSQRRCRDQELQEKINATAQG